MRRKHLEAWRFPWPLPCWLQRQHGMDDYLETMVKWSTARGTFFGLKMAEGFRRYKGHPFPQTPLLEELLGPELVFARHVDQNLP